jgi:aspartyl protease family protein
MIRGAFLFALAGVALALAALARVPDFAPAKSHITPTTPAPVAAQAAPATESEAKGFAYREASLQADPRGQYSADALVNGSPVRMLVDTGATAVVISASTAARVGAAAGSGPKWRVKTANGETIASPSVLNSVSFGGLYLNDVQALILSPEAGEVNLLGASFLKRLVSVEQHDGILILRQ